MINKFFNLILVAILLVLLYNKELEYGEIQILKVAVSVGFGYLVFLAIKAKSYPWVPLFVFFGLVFLPFFEFKIESETWELIDIIAIVALLLHFIFSLINRHGGSKTPPLTEEELRVKKAKRKKVIEREVWYFVLCLLVASLGFLGSFIYSNIQESRVNKLERKIYSELNKIDNIKSEYSNKELNRKRLFEKHLSIYGNENIYSNSTDLWNRLEELHKADSIVYKWNNVWSNSFIEVHKDFGFKKGKEFDSFIEENLYTKSELEKINKVDSIANKIRPIEKQIESTKQKVFSFEEQIRFTIAFLLVILIIVFPIRGLVYLISRSVKT